MHAHHAGGPDARRESGVRVRTCDRCPYSPMDLAPHHDPEAEMHCCARCDETPPVATNTYVRERRFRRGKMVLYPVNAHHHEQEEAR